jgi:predicted Zn-dependent protease with MMP-like domain/Tfp pilus assembly protein PilF
MKRHGEPTGETDEIAGHLDRGWDLLEDNELAGARISAEQALAVDPDSPDALTLAGAVRGAEGDEDEALRLYEKAMERDPEYVSPMLFAAEIYLWSVEDHDEALRLVERALDLAEDEGEYLNALLLKAEALIAKGDDTGAEKVLDELPPVGFPEGGLHARAARCYLDLDMPDEAEEHFEKALAIDEKDSDAWHGIGMVHEAREDTRAMVKAWLRVRELDLDEPPVGWALSQDEFEKVAEEALGEIPERIRKLLENVPIVASDYPSIEIVAEGNDPRMLGFFSGVPYPDKSNLFATPHLDCVFLYQRNIERMSRSTAELRAEIRITLLHETGHFFGLSEEELDEMGLG